MVAWALPLYPDQSAVALPADLEQRIAQWKKIGPASERLQDASIDEVVVTDTIPVPAEKRFEALTILPIAPLLARAIREVFEDGSVTSMFDGAA